MSRLLRALCLMLLVAACGSSNNTAPRNLDNACSIVKQRPKLLKAMKRTERNWGVPVHVQMATIYQESKFIGNAKTPHQFALGVIPTGRQSSAYGYSQALDGTWDEYRKATRNRSGRRNNIHDATDFIGWYMARSTEVLGIDPNDTGNHYLAYHEGRSGYARGSHKSKSWLLRVSSEVDARAELYQRQLIACGKV
ncbi:MAG: transglycosylase SLT domain-containing protein [Paracoccaceae bacterium]